MEDYGGRPGRRLCHEALCHEALCHEALCHEALCHEAEHEALDKTTDRGKPTEESRRP